VAVDGDFCRIFQGWELGVDAFALDVIPGCPKARHPFDKLRASSGAPGDLASWRKHCDQVPVAIEISCV